MAPKKKVAKQSVNYRKATKTRRCGNCVMYHAGACDLVAGKIEPTYVCDRWQAK